MTAASVPADFVREAVAEIVARQVREGAPPEVGQNLARLMATGYLREEALALIGCVLSREMSDCLDTGAAFDAPHYVAALAILPALPWA